MIVFELIPFNVFVNTLIPEPNIPIQVGDPTIRVVLDFYIEFSTLSGSTVYSNQFSYSLEFCYGCLDGLVSPYDTPKKCLDAGGTLKGGCNLGQDIVATCTGAAAS